MRHILRQALILCVLTYTLAGCRGIVPLPADAATPATSSTSQTPASVHTSSIVLTSSSSVSALGTTFVFTATVTPSSSTGQVTFKDSDIVLGDASLVAGVAAFRTSGLAPGAHSITAVYGGDSSDQGSASAALNLVVAPPAVQV